MHGAWIPLFVALWLVVVVLVVLVTGLITRISGLEAHLTGERQAVPLGPKVGLPAPVVRGYERLSTIDAGGRGRIVLFLGPPASACGEFARDLRRHLEDESATPDVDLVVVLDGPDIDALAGLRGTPLVVENGRPLALAWNIPSLPFAVVIDRDGVVLTGTLVGDPTDLLNLPRLLPGAVQLPV